MNSQVWWFVARSSGIIAWALLTVAVVWGLLLSTKVSATRIAARRLTPAWLLSLHRHLGGLAVIFTLIHLVGIVADSYVSFGWAEILVPMASQWKPGAVAFGVVSMYLLFAIEATSLAMRRMPRKMWRWVHRTSFALYATATYHGITAGTDAGNQWFRIASWISVVVVVALTLRLLLVLRRSARRNAPPIEQELVPEAPVLVHAPATEPAVTIAMVELGASPLVSGIAPLLGQPVEPAATIAATFSPPPPPPPRPLPSQLPPPAVAPLAPPLPERDLVGANNVTDG